LQRLAAKLPEFYDFAHYILNTVAHHELLAVAHNDNRVGRRLNAFDKVGVEHELFSVEPLKSDHGFVLPFVFCFDEYNTAI
jgi:hypothetical protein